MAAFIPVAGVVAVSVLEEMRARDAAGRAAARKLPGFVRATNYKPWTCAECGVTAQLFGDLCAKCRYGEPRRAKCAHPGACASCEA